jgi:hypothetical protein
MARGEDCTRVLDPRAEVGQDALERSQRTVEFPQGVRYGGTRHPHVGVLLVVPPEGHGQTVLPVDLAGQLRARLGRRCAERGQVLGHGQLAGECLGALRASLVCCDLGHDGRWVQVHDRVVGVPEHAGLTGRDTVTRRQGGRRCHRSLATRH